MDQSGDRPAGPETGREPGPEIAAGQADRRPGRLRLALAAQEQKAGLMARRAERLARIRAGASLARSAPGAAGADGSAPGTALADEFAPGAARARLPEDGPEDEPVLSESEVDALERFLAGLVGTIETEPAPSQPARIAPPVVPLTRRAAPLPAGPGRAAGGEDLGRLPGGEGLARLPGAGPGLVGTLIRVGVPDLSALARLGPQDLADRLGPVSRLIDLEGWIAFAQAETRETGEGPGELPAAG